MVNVPIGPAQDFMVDILIINIRVRITRIIVYATYTDNQHRGISSDLPAKK